MLFILVRLNFAYYYEYLSISAFLSYSNASYSLVKITVPPLHLLKCYPSWTQCACCIATNHLHVNIIMCSMVYRALL